MCLPLQARNRAPVNEANWYYYVCTEKRRPWTVDFCVFHQWPTFTCLLQKGKPASSDSDVQLVAIYINIREDARVSVMDPERAQ